MLELCLVPTRPLRQQVCFPAENVLGWKKDKSMFNGSNRSQWPVLRQSHKVAQRVTRDRVRDHAL